jgi:hypothetical protein
MSRRIYLDCFNKNFEIKNNHVLMGRRAEGWDGGEGIDLKKDQVAERFLNHNP